MWVRGKTYKEKHRSILCICQKQKKSQSHPYTNLYTLTCMHTHIMHMRNLHLNFTKERQWWAQTQVNGSTHTHTHTHTQNPHVMLFGFLSRTTTYLITTEKKNINLLAVSIHCTVFRVNINALINLKRQPKASWNKSGIVETLILKHLIVLD